MSKKNSNNEAMSKEHRNKPREPPTVQNVYNLASKVMTTKVVQNIAEGLERRLNSSEH